MSTPIPKPIPATTTSSSSSDPVTASLPTSTAHPHKPPFIRPAPPLFIGKPINPPGGAVTAAPFYHSAGSARGFPPRALADRMVTVASPAGYIRSSGAPTSVMSLQAQMLQHHQQQHHQQQQHQHQHQHQSLPPVGAHHPMRAPHQLVVPRQQVGSCGPPHSSAAAVAMQPKAAPFPAASPVPENIANDKDKREDTIVVIHDRKVRLSEGSSGSLYALCRSWVRNGLPQESQPTIGDGSKLLPKPLPASVVNSRALEVSEDANEVEHSDKDEDLASGEQLSAQDLLRGHIKRAKKVRARLRQERLLRIERYKQRLSLLLPTQTELIGRNEATPGS